MSVLKTYGEDKFSFKPSKTYKLTQSRIEGKVDGIEAVKQAVYLALSTERFEYIIFSWDYGVELTTLIGRDRPFVRGDIERRIVEALMEDDRVKGVENFSAVFDHDVVTVYLTVISQFGNFDVERRARVG